MFSWLKEERYAAPFLFVFAILLYFPFLGYRDLWAPVEPRYGEIARVMFNRGEWLVPMVNGSLYTDKPILYFWLVLLFSNIPGGVSEWSLRMPSALSGMGLVFLTYLFGRDFINKQAALLSALIFATAGLVIWESSWAHTDMLFTFFFTLSIYFLFRLWMERGGRIDATIAYGAMALATLTKGMIGFVLPGLVMGLFLLVTRDWRKIRALYLPTGILVFLLFAVPWFVAVAVKTDWVWLREFVWEHHVQRYLGGVFHHRKPFYYYFLNFPLGFLPWTIVFFPALAGSFRIRNIPSEPVFLFIAVWFLAVFFFFSLSDTKRGLYLLPLFPAASLFVGDYLTTLDQAWRPSVSVLRWALIIFLLALALSGLALPFVSFKYFLGLIGGSLVLALTYISGGFIALSYVRKERWSSTIVATAVTLLAGTLCVSYWVLPAIDTIKSPRNFAAVVKERVSPQDRLYVYRDSMHDFNFYLAREVIPVLTQPEEVRRALAEGSFLMVREKDLRRSLAGFDLETKILLRRKVGSENWRLVGPQGAG